MAQEAKGKKRDGAELTLEQKLTLIHGRTDGRLEALKEINWKLGQYLEDKTNMSPEMQRLSELKKIGVIMAIQEIEARRKRRELERGKVPRPLRRKELPNDLEELRLLYREINQRYKRYMEDLEPITDKLKEVLSKDLMKEAKNLWVSSKQHAVTLKELNSLDESSDLRAINEEEKKLLALLTGREEHKPVVRRPPRPRRKRPVEIPPPDLKPYYGLIGGGAGAAVVGVVLFLMLGFTLMGMILLVALLGAGGGLIGLGSFKIKRANEEYALAKRRAEAEAMEEEPPPRTEKGEAEG